MPRLFVVDELFAAPEFSRYDARFLNFYRRLPDFGWEPLVFSQYLSRRFNGLRRMGRLLLPHLFNGEVRNGGVSVRLGVPPPVRPGANGVHGGFAAPFLQQVARGLLRRRPMDLLYSSGHSVESHQFAAKIAAQHDMPWVADFSRLLMLASLEEKAATALPHDAEILFRGVVKSGGLVIVHTEEVRNRWLGLFPRLPRARVRIVPDGFDGSIGEELLERNGEKKSLFTLLFAQPLVNMKALSTLLQALAAVFAKHPSWKNEFRVLWRGPLSGRMMEVLHRKQMEKIFHRIREEEWRGMARLPEFHVLLALPPEQIHGDFFVTPMLHALLAARRPLLAIGPEAGIRRLVREEGLGREFATDDARGVAAALIYWFVEFKSGAFSMLSQLPADLTHETTARKLVELLNHVWRQAEPHFR